MNKYLPLIRGALLVLVVLFVITFVILWLEKGSADYKVLTPIIGLLFFYFITRPKAD